MTDPADDGLRMPLPLASLKKKKPKKKKKWDDIDANSGSVYHEYHYKTDVVDDGRLGRPWVVGIVQEVVAGLLDLVVFVEGGQLGDDVLVLEELPDTVWADDYDSILVRESEF